MKYLSIFILVCVFFACNPNHTNNDEGNKDFIIEHTSDPNNKDPFNRAVRRYYSKLLRMYGEPCIDEEFCTKDTPFYRFSIENRFDSSIIVRIEKLDSLYILTYKLIGPSFNDRYVKDDFTDFSYEVHRKKVKKIVWDSLQFYLNKINFWNLDLKYGPYWDAPHFNIEGYQNNYYRKVIRQRPPKDFMEVCKFFARLAGKENLIIRSR